MSHPLRLLSVLVASAAASTLAAACGSSSGAGPGGDGGSSSSGGSSGGDPCAGLGCASAPGTLVVQVVDAVGAPVASPTFAENGQALQAFCETGGGQILADASTCGSWHLDTLSIGAHTITVGAPGYEPQTLSVTIQGPAGCCGMGAEVDETVTLFAPHGDAGNPGDAGSLPCGPQTCDAATQYCSIVNGHFVDGATTGYACTVIPVCDAGSGCACLGGGACVCDDEAGSITVTCDYP